MYRRALRRAKKYAYPKKNKNRKIPLLFPIVEKNDWIVPDYKNEESEIQISFKVVGTSSIKEYKDTIKKIHKTHNERLIGQNTKTEFFLSQIKLKELMNDVEFLKEHYQNIKDLSNIDIH